MKPVQQQPVEAAAGRRVLVSVVTALVALVMLAGALMGPGGASSSSSRSLSWSAGNPYQPPRIEVYSQVQATRAAKAAVAKLQQIEARRPMGLAAGNPLALPRTNETDLSRERRRRRQL